MILKTHSFFNHFVHWILLKKLNVFKIIELLSQLVAADEAVANRQFAEAQYMKDDCEKELAKAVPALSSASQALNTLKVFK